jgi:predicted nucleotidyltransferase
MRPTFTIEDIFETPARVKILRVLATAHGALSIRAAGRAAGVSHTTASAVLRDLESMGLAGSRPIGRARAFWLVTDNAYVRRMIMPAIDGERAVVDDLRRDLVAAFGPDAVSVVLFGSWAYGDQDGDSDIDVLVLAEDERRKQALEEAANACAERFARTYGSPLAPLIFTRAEAASRLAIGKSALRLELESTGIILHGLGPREWGIDGPEDESARDIASSVAPVPEEGDRVR